MKATVQDKQQKLKNKTVRQKRWGNMQVFLKKGRQS